MFPQTTYPRSNISPSKIQVYYEGSDTIKNGYAFCYNADYGASAATAEASRLSRVEKAAAANVDYFAGVAIDIDERNPAGGITGPCELTIALPDGRAVEVFTNQNCTLGSTRLYLQIDSYYAGGVGPVCIGRALQTVNRSDTNGLALAELRTADIDRADNQEANSSTTFTDAIWQNFPLALLRRNPHLGTFVEYDPTFRPEQQIPERAEYTGAHNSVTETHVAATTLAAIERNLVVSQDASAADNDACAVQFPGPVVLTGGKPWAFEVVFDLTTVTNTDMETMVGLMTAETLANTVPFADGGVIAATVDAVYFDIKTDDGDGLDVSYVATGETAVLHQANVGAPTANTAIKVAMYYNGTTIATYVNGTAKTAITAADIASGTDVFPAGVTAYLTAAIKGDSGVQDADDLNIRAFRVAQLA